MTASIRVRLESRSSTMDSAGGIMFQIPSSRPHNRRISTTATSVDKKLKAKIARATHPLTSPTITAILRARLVPSHPSR